VSAVDPYLSEQRRRAALIRWSMQDPREHGEKVRQSRLEMFRRQADPDGSLSDAERDRRAQALIDAHMSKMRAARAQARRAS
jgi:hypothetical protein